MKYAIIFAAALTLAACGAESESAGSGESAAQTAEAPSPAPSAATTTTPEERGRKLFNECAICHTVKEGDPHRVGPNLFGVVGRSAGKADGFAYSKAFTDSDVVWTEENLSAFIENPQAFMRGNRMAYVGQRDAEKRADLIAYLKTLK